jgi:hypothetical protein
VPHLRHRTRSAARWDASKRQTHVEPQGTALTSHSVHTGREATPDHGHRPWTNDEIGAIIEGITDPDHLESFELAQAKGFGSHVSERWSQVCALSHAMFINSQGSRSLKRFRNKHLNGQRSGRAAWSKLKEIKDIYREVRDLHKETGNGGLLQLEDNDSKAETMKKLSTRIRIKMFESQAGKLKYLTSKEIYYNWVKGGKDSWFARMHSWSVFYL